MSGIVVAPAGAKCADCGYDLANLRVWLRGNEGYAHLGPCPSRANPPGGVPAVTPGDSLVAAQRGGMDTFVFVGGYVYSRHAARIAELLAQLRTA